MPPANSNIYPSGRIEALGSRFLDAKRKRGARDVSRAPLYLLKSEVAYLRLELSSRIRELPSRDSDRMFRQNSASERSSEPTFSLWCGHGTWHGEIPFKRTTCFRVEMDHSLVVGGALFGFRTTFSFFGPIVPQQAERNSGTGPDHNVPYSFRISNPEFLILNS